MHNLHLIGRYRFSNRFLRERGIASSPKIKSQVFLYIFQKNSAMAKYLRFEGNGKIPLGQDGLPCWLSQFSFTKLGRLFSITFPIV